MRTRSRLLSIAAAAALLTTAAGCGSDSPADPAGAPKLAVVATTTQVADFTRNIGGNHVDVAQILQPNVDPHDYDPSPADLEEIRAAKVVVKNGVGIEGWFDKTIESAGFAGTVVDASAGITIREGHEEEGEEHAEEEGEEHAEGDPHLWHNPQNAKAMAANIQQALAAADPANAPAYQQNFAAYAAKLDKLDADIKAKIDTIPAANRKLVTNHDAFGYYVEHFGLEFVGSIIPSFDTSAELSAQDVDAIVAKIKATGAKAVFSESSLPAKTAEAIARQAGVQVVAGEDALYADTLGPAGTPGATYLSMAEHNTDVIVKALRG